MASCQLFLAALSLVTNGKSRAVIIFGIFGSVRFLVHILKLIGHLSRTFPVSSRLNGQGSKLESQRL